MKSIGIRVLFCAITLFLFSASLSAQQFNWIKGGGTNADLSSLPSSQWESVKHMCTDQHGNVYAASLVGNADVYADAFSGPTFGYYQNILITSYNCSGQMRWAKIIASSGGGCTPFGIAADSLGHIYLAGQLPAATLHIGTDTTLPGAVYERIGLIQFDTNGHYNWIRYVGNNALSTFHATGTVAASLVIDNMNNAHFIPYIYSGAVLMSGVTSQYGNYDLTYNTSGTLLSAVRLQLDSTLAVIKVTIDKQSNKLFTYGHRSPAFWILDGGDSSSYNFLAEFDVSRNLQWKDTIGTGYDAVGLVSGIVADGFGHLYACSGGLGYMVYNGVTISPPAGAVGNYISAIMKLDTAGNMKWIKQCNGHNGVGFNDLTLMPGNKVAATGNFVGLANTGVDTIISPTGYAGYFTVLDSSGTLIALQRIHGDQTNNLGNAITTDTIGNLYIGGQVTDTIPDTLITSYHSIGGNSDFFVLKYGVDCSCTSMPVAAFTHTGIATVHVNYTGTTSGLDSVVWNFGDGTIGHGLTTSHTYTVVGTVDLCVTVYTSCGYDIKCSNIVVNCPGTPVSSFTNNGSSPVNFTYTGTTSGLDSVSWAFGDGGTSTGTTTSHTYAAVGSYTVCATTYTACGNSVGCNAVNISCVAAPAPSFTDTGSHTLGFVYTAPTTALDSIVWSFGDGSTANGATVSHTYAVADTYLVCVTAYNACGSDSVCHKVITHTTGIGSLTIADVKVYPNPAMNQLMVTGITYNTNYRLLSVTGVSLQSGTLHSGINSIPMRNYAPGIYLLELTGADGAKKNLRVVKE